MWGAIEAETERGPIGQWEAERDEYGLHLSAVSGPEFDRGLAEGRAMTLEQTVEYGLSVRLAGVSLPGDLRDWIALLEREGELVRVSAEVDPNLEVTEIVDRVVKAGGPALLFENPKDSQHPLLINQFGTERRMCLAFGADSLDDVGRRLGDVLEMQPPQGIAEKVRGLKKLKSIADSQPKSVRSGAVRRSC